MTGEIRVPKSEVQAMAEAAERIDLILNQAKELAAKLKKTSDALNRIVGERDGDNVSADGN